MEKEIPASRRTFLPIGKGGGKVSTVAEQWRQQLERIRLLQRERPLERHWWDAQEGTLVDLLRRLETGGEAAERIVETALEDLVHTTSLAREVRLLEEADVWPIAGRRVERLTLEQVLAGAIPPAPPARDLQRRSPARSRRDLLRDLARGRAPYRYLDEELPPREAEQVKARLHLLLELQTVTGAESRGT